jgi:hypothetical protein
MWKDGIFSKGISLTVLNYRAPRTLANTLRTWYNSGLLNLTYENIAILSDPYDSEIAMAKHYGFKVVEPRMIPNAKMSKPNVLTIGAAFFYALRKSKGQYMLFLENDFKIDTSLSVDTLKMELLAAISLLDSGAEIIRLMSRKYQGCGTFKSCDHGGIHLRASTSQERKRNW